MVYMPHWPKILEFKPEGVTLDRISEILRRLGNPQKSLPPVVHVAGTNGKGSTIAFLEYMLRAAGLRVHVYTSPHLTEFNERIVLSGTRISDSYLYEILEECRIAVDDSMPVTFFEATTAAALLAFSRIKADILLLEVGMGGRLDATNVVDPILSIVTSISMDHASFLGNTVELIAGEKAGIMKEGVTCVSAPQVSSVMSTLEYHAAERKAPLYRGGVEWFSTRDGENLVFKNSMSEYRFPLPSLLGDHQVVNAGNAIAACSILSGKFGYEICAEDIEQGLVTAKWPARLEQIRSGCLHKMLPHRWRLFLDGAHNVAGAKALTNWINTYLESKELYVVLGMTKERDVREFLSPLKKHITFLCTVCVKSEYKAQSAEDILKSALTLNINASAEKDIKSAIEKFLVVGNTSVKATVLVCGSLFLAGDMIRENVDIDCR